MSNNLVDEKRMEDAAIDAACASLKWDKDIRFKNAAKSYLKNGYDAYRFLTPNQVIAFRTAYDGAKAATESAEAVIIKLKVAIAQAAVPLEALLICRAAGSVNLSEHSWSEIENGVQYARNTLNQETSNGQAQTDD